MRYATNANSYWFADNIRDSGTGAWAKVSEEIDHGPLTRIVGCAWARNAGTPPTFSPPPLVSDPSMHHGTCVTHVPWCMSGSRTRGGGENVSVPGACATHNFTYLVRGPSNKNIERHTAHTIVSWPNPKQWVIVHTSDLMMIIRQSIYSLNHYKGDG